MNDTLSALIQKHDTSGPRYTSYPPAPIFSPSFGHEKYRAAILETEQHFDNPSVSLYVHIPFCDTLCYFCGCTTIINRNQTHHQEYVQYIKKEIEMLASLIHRERRVVQMHWGGGTPTFLSPTLIQDLASHLFKSFTFDSSAEISIEVDPRDVTYNHLKTLHAVGFNRISLGVQDFNPRVQQAVNRNQSQFISRQVIDWSRDLGFSSANVDLIYGLPMQTAESFAETLDNIIEISPERIAVYNFAYVPWMKKHQRLIHHEDLPSAETKIKILTMTIEKLLNSGYVYVGMDHFAKPNDELTIAQRSKTLHRNFQGYSTKAGSDLYGFGLSAISHFGIHYAQNAKTLPDYYSAIDARNFATHVGYRMTPDDEIRKYVILRLMCDLKLMKQDVEEKFQIKFDDYFAPESQKLQPLIDDQFILSAPDCLIVTEIGRLFLRNIAMCFDAYLQTTPIQQPLYSKTV